MNRCNAWLALPFAAMVAASPEPVHPQDRAPELKVLSWNVKLLSPWAAMGLGTTKNMKRRAAAQGTLIAAQGADVVGLNEGFAKTALRRLVARATEGNSLVPIATRQPRSSDTDPRPNGGLALLVDPALTASGGPRPMVWHDCNPVSKTVDCLAKKGVLYARLSLPRNELDINVFVAHLQAGGEETSATTRAKQLEELRSLIEATVTGGADHPTFVMGDFNIGGRCRTCKRREQRLVEALATPSLGSPVDVYLEECPSADCTGLYKGGVTHLGASQRKYPWLDDDTNNPTNTRYDYILYYPRSAGWETRYVRGSYEVDPMITTPGQTLDIGPGSDHLAISASFTFHPRPPS